MTAPLIPGSSAHPARFRIGQLHVLLLILNLALIGVLGWKAISAHISWSKLHRDGVATTARVVEIGQYQMKGGPVSWAEYEYTDTHGAKLRQRVEADSTVGKEFTLLYDGTAPQENSLNQPKGIESTDLLVVVIFGGAMNFILIQFIRQQRRAAATPDQDTTPIRTKRHAPQKATLRSSGVGYTAGIWLSLMGTMASYGISGDFRRSHASWTEMKTEGVKAVATVISCNPPRAGGIHANVRYEYEDASGQRHENLAFGGIGGTLSISSSAIAKLTPGDKLPILYLRSRPDHSMWANVPEPTTNGPILLRVLRVAFPALLVLLVLRLVMRIIKQGNASQPT